MDARSFVVVVTLFATAGIVTAGQARTPPPSPEARAAWEKHGLDPASRLELRLRASSPVLQELFAETTTQPTSYVLSDADRRQISAAFAALPPLHRRVLQERLRSLVFFEGVAQTGLALPLERDAPYPLFDIAIRATVLRQTLSELATTQDRRHFVEAGSTARVSIETGGANALLFVLLHEATHVVDRVLALSPRIDADGRAVAGVASTPFTGGIWVDWQTHEPAIGHGALDAIRLHPGKRAPMAHAADVYTALSGTPFASLYGSANWSEDLAELVAWHHLTEKLGYPYRIAIRDGDRTTFSYEPMHAPLVRARFGQLARFYAAPDDAVTGGRRSPRPGAAGPHRRAPTGAAR